MTTLQNLMADAQAMHETLIETRRALHRIPEPGFAEIKTQALIMKRLDALGIPYSTERTWVIAEIQGALPGGRVALRADMDALPIQEPQGCPFRSTHDGYMHACGHDAHTAIQLGAAQLLAQRRNELRGSIRLLFQPAEETEGGALPMAQAGAMDGVDAVYGLHVQPYMLVGDIDSRPGCLNASTDEVRIRIRGVSGHAARPEQCVDAIVCAAQMITALQTVVSRGTSPLDSAVLSLGTIHGGEARNVICDSVEIGGTLRTVDPRLRERLHERIRSVCAGIAAACQAQCDCAILPGYAPLMNDEGEFERVLRLGRRLLGAEHVHRRTSPSMGGEDFSYFAERAPGAFWHLGCSAKLPAPTLHSKDLVVDERCLPIGVALECALALDRLNCLENEEV